MKSAKQYIKEAKKEFIIEKQIDKFLFEEDFLPDDDVIEEKALKGQMTFGGGAAAYIFGLGPIGLALYATYKVLRKKYEKAKRDCKTNLCLKETRIKEAEEKIKMLQKLLSKGNDKEKKRAKYGIQKLKAYIDQVKSTKA